MTKLAEVAAGALPSSHQERSVAQPRSGVTPSEGSEAATRAIGWLRRAVGVGYRNANEVRIESALDPLRSRDDFRLLLLDLAFPAEPFAPTQPIP